jgi:hypothetical protein
MINWPQKNIDDWIHLQKELDLLSTCVFRGQGSRHWPLTPSFNRLLPRLNESDALQLEFQMILKFRREAHLHLNSSVMSPDVFKLDRLDTYCEWLMLMQHYGAPTRLLDWTDSPYVAIYFAVVDQWDLDAALWYFDPRPAVSIIYQHYGKSQGVFLDYADMSSNDIRLVDNTPMLYIAIKKMRTAREVAQQGVFTFTNRLMANDQDVVALTCHDCEYGCMIIPKELKPEFLFRLRTMNVTAASLFPGVEGICDSIQNDMRLAASQNDMRLAASSFQTEKGNAT